MSTLSPKRVARAMGVSESSLKRWCDQGLITMEKTAGGHRRLQIDSVIRFLRDSKRELVHPELLGLPANIGRSKCGIEAAREVVGRALKSGDQALYRQAAVDMFLSGLTIAAFVDEVLAPVLFDVGEEWECHRMDIYQERRGCEITLRVLHELTTLLPPVPAVAPLAIGCSIWCDPYILPTTAVEAVLLQQGWRARSLGNQIPFDSMRAAVRDLKPDLFWISVSCIDDEDHFCHEYRSFHDDVGHSTSIVLGGRAIHETLRQRITFSACCDRLQHLESFVQSLSRVQKRTESSTSPLEGNR